MALVFSVWLWCLAGIKAEKVDRLAQGIGVAHGPARRRPPDQCLRS